MVAMVRKGFDRVWSDIPIEWKEILERLIEEESPVIGAKSISEYIRALIREDLTRRGLIAVESVS